MESPPIIDYIYGPGTVDRVAHRTSMRSISRSSASSPASRSTLSCVVTTRACIRGRMMFIWMPYAFIDSTFGVQDETISTFIFLLPLFFFVVGRLRRPPFRYRRHMTKFFNGVIYPGAADQSPTNEGPHEDVRYHRVDNVGRLVPFLIIAPDKFLKLPVILFPTGQDACPDRWLEYVAFLGPGRVHFARDHWASS